MTELASYPYIIAIGAAWGLAHTIKYLLAIARRRRISFRDVLFQSGGMPSSHSAIVTSVAMLVGLDQGFDTALFGIALTLAMITIYDATHVRYMAGVTAEATRELVAKSNSKTTTSLRVHRGHTGREAAMGVLLGVVVASVVFFTTQYFG